MGDPSLSLLYASHGFTYWGERMWEFSSIIFIMEIYKTTLLPSSLFGICENISVLLFGGAIGHWVDRTDRLSVVSLTLLLQNASIVVGALLFLILNEVDVGTRSPFFHLGFAGILLAGMIARLGFTGSSISVEKEWVRCMSRTKGKRWLVDANATMRRIDLCCKILAPLLSATVASIFGSPVCMGFIGVYNTLCGFAEYLLLKKLYYSEPCLQDRANGVAGTDLTVAEAGGGAGSEGEGASLLQQGQAGSRRGFWRRQEYRWRTYFSEPVVFGSLAFGMLFGSIISWGSIFTSYLKWQGAQTKDWELALGRAVAAGFGVLATYVVPLMISKYRIIRPAMLGTWGLTLVEVPVLFYFAVSQFGWMGEYGWVQWMLVDGNWHYVVFPVLCVSRFFLWTFDLCWTQIVQESVPEGRLGEFCGCQSSVTSIMYFVSFMLGVIWPNPASFAYPIIVSWCCVAACSILFCLCTVRMWAGGLLGQTKGPEDCS